MAWTDYIEVNPTVKGGRPVVKGTRLTVEFILGLVAQGWSADELVGEYPTLTREGIAACLEFEQAKLPFKDRMVSLGQTVVDSLNYATLKQAAERETDLAKRRELDARIAELERLASE